MNFIPLVINTNHNSTDNYYFIFANNQLIVKNEVDRTYIPEDQDISAIKSQIQDLRFFGTWDKKACYIAHIEKTETPEGLELMNFRDLFGKVNIELLELIGRASQLYSWDRTNIFCSKCGTKLQDKTNEHAKVCESCDEIKYHSAFPAIMVTIKKGDKILLVQTKERPYFHSVVAGFVDPGESLENAVRREVKEEVDINIKNVEYFGSQPFAPSNSIMIGFTAEYESGTIKKDDKEIASAGWFSNEDIPKSIPPDFSLAGQLIKHSLSN